MLNDLTIKRNNLVVFVVLCLFLYGCNNKYPYKPDYENALGLVIGTESCKMDATQNAWFIQLPGPNAGNKTYGENITYNNKSYSNVVKTYTLPDTSKTVGKRYFFQFYVEDKPISQSCDVENPLKRDIVNIRIKLLVPVAN